MAIGKARLVRTALGVALLGAATLAATSAKSLRAESRRALSINDAVIDFGRNGDRVTIKADIDGPLGSKNTDHFYVRVIITDRRDSKVYDTQDQFPTAVR